MPTKTAERHSCSFHDVGDPQLSSHKLLETDLIIIGGGPGGCAAAISSATAGLRTVLVERLTFPRHRPGETLPPGVEPLFRQLGVWEEIECAGFIRHLGQRVAWVGESKFSGFGGTEEEPWRGFQAWRPVLDAILLRRAVGVGVEVWQPCAALSPVKRDGRVIGVVTDRGEVRARYVVDATGGTGWLARKLECAVERRSPQLFASYGYVQTERASEWFVPELQSTAAGWMWIAQVLPRVVAWSQLALSGKCAGMPSRLVRLPDARRLGVGRASADVTWRVASNAAGSGYFAVGDAAVVLDPASSHGVLRALMSGMVAAHLSARVCRGELEEESAAASYASWLREWFEHDAEKLRTFYRRLDIPMQWASGFRQA